MSNKDFKPMVKPISRNNKKTDEKEIQELMEIAEAIEEPADPGVTEVVVTTPLNMRKRPDVTSPVIKVLDEGCTIKIDPKFKNSDWHKIFNQDAYIMKRYTREIV